MKQPIRVVIAHDHPFMREGLASVLARQPDLTVVGVATTGREALDLVARHQPDVLVADMHLPVLSGLAALWARQPRAVVTRVILLTISNERNVVLPLLTRGTTGYLLYVHKDTAARDLLETIRGVVDGRVGVAGLGAPAPPLPTLTPREHDVLTLLAQGCSNYEMATALSISVRTVHAHRANLYRKLAVHNGGELLLVALRHHLIHVA